TMFSSQSPSGDDQNVPPKGKKKKEKEVFCICREPAGDRFMIGCDKCDEWYHGDCVLISRDMGNQIHQYYCKACIAKDPTLVITKKETEKLIIMRCIQCVNCLRLADCGECNNCVNKRGRCLHVPCLNPVVKPSSFKIAENKTLEIWEPLSALSALSAVSTPFTPAILDKVIDAVASTSPPKEEEMSKSGRMTRGRRNGFRKNKQEKVIKGKGRELQKQLRKEFDTQLSERLKKGTAAYSEAFRSPSVSPEKDDCEQGPRQCQAKECSCFAREGSKYCSDECGMALARKHLLLNLPRGVQNYWRIATVKKPKEELREEPKEELIEEPKEEL
ncbi:hypothetical protein PRIPAC_73063, partial [Pristionchus pacificus]